MLKTDGLMNQKESCNGEIDRPRQMYREIKNWDGHGAVWLTLLK